ncbi:MAG: TldD/PmbA family protein [Chloroflexi bacterium]|nr:TldD/PmbA family protein [Chloroflexota bacterium]
MPEPISVGFLDGAKPVVASAASQYARRLRDLRYCDIRVEVSEGRACAAENGDEKHSAQDYRFSLGVRVLAGDGVVAPGYCGRFLGTADAQNFAAVVRQAVLHAHCRALANAQRKASARARFGSLGGALKAASLPAVPPRQATVPAVCRVDPRQVPLPTVVKLVTETSRAVAGVSSQVAFNVVACETSLMRELFASSEGSLIDQSFAFTEGFVFVVSRGQHGNLELYDFTGHQRGWEVLEEGYQSEHILLPSLMEFALDLARTTVEVSNAPPLKPPEGEVVVVSDPHFNALVCHEVVGHPSELDRALKLETAYAGRSWLFKDFQDNQLGRQMASPLVSVFSDPTVEGFGHYLYDHEGTPARRVHNIRGGVYEEFLSSRETAALLGRESNGHYKAAEAHMVPLIRMSNTAFGPGDRDPQQILKEVDRGYYVVGHRIPSVAESRENFRISAMRVYEIRNGELGQLYRDGAVMADSRDFFMHIDAVGKDFRLFPIPNCGKGQPMQAKRMGNGGPTMRSVARLTGPGR